MSGDANAEYADPKITENYTLLQAFEWYCDGEGKHWDLVQDRVGDLSEMGITAMWLPPPTKAAGPTSVGYDIYDMYDLGEFDQKGGKATKYGTKEQYLELVKKAKDAGIIVYIDAVLNHKFGADDTETFAVTEVDPDNRTTDVSELHDIKGWTKFDFPGRGDKYSSLKWNFNHFTGVDYDAESEKTAIYRIHGDGKTWAEGVDGENQNYDYLMGADVDHTHPEARKDMLDWGSWVLNETGAVGFRFDAVKHIDAGFISEFVKTVREKSGIKKMFAVGEFWKDSLDSLEKYLGSLDTQFSVFDAPLHYNFKQAGDQAENYDIRKIWDDTVVASRPIDAVTLVDNHDTQVGQALESWVSPTFKPLAYAMILLRPSGYPCVFWGDLYGTKGENPQEPVSQLAEIIKARKLYAFGELRDYWDHMNCVGWVRAGTEKRPDGCAVVLCNGSNEGEKHMEVGTLHANETWTDVLGWYPGEVVIGEDGWADFKCSERSVSIWVKKEAEGRS